MNYLHDIVVVLFRPQHDHSGNCCLFHTRPLNLTHRLIPWLVRSMPNSDTLFSTVPNPCVTNPCLHDGTCIDTFSKYTGFPMDWDIGYLHYYCMCLPEYSGQKCEGTLVWVNRYLPSNKKHCYITRLSLNKMSTVIFWFLVTCSWWNSKVSRPGYN